MFLKKIDTSLKLLRTLSETIKYINTKFTNIWGTAKKCILLDHNQTDHIRSFSLTVNLVVISINEDK